MPKKIIYTEPSDYFSESAKKVLREELAKANAKTAKKAVKKTAPKKTTAKKTTTKKK